MDLRPIRARISEALQNDPPLCPLLIRFSWHCCGTYDRNLKNGGSNGGTMRFKTEREDPENAGFQQAYDLFDTIKETEESAKEMSFADLYILGGYVAIEWSGGPKLPFKTGRVDFTKPIACEQYGESGCPFGDGNFNPNGSRLPSADLGLNDESTDPCEREKKTIEGMRQTFSRLGMSDGETVALMLLGHQFGQGHLEVSGYEGFWFPPAPNDWNISKRSRGGGYFAVYKSLHNFKEVHTAKGKRQYENNRLGPKFLMLPVDMALAWDPSYKSHLSFYDKNRSAFFADASLAWRKLTELGCEGILSDEMKY